MNITRNKREQCVVARIVRQKQLYQKSFAVRKFGTWQTAEEEASLWVAGMLKTLPPKMSSRNRYTYRNHSGVVGVHLRHSIRKKQNGKEYLYWRWYANWPGCKNKGGISWSIDKFGDDDAFVLAYLSRKMETVDRKAVEIRLKRLRNRKEYREILSMKQLNAPPRN